MDINEIWDRALKNTEIIRSRLQSLKTYSSTHVPYILLSESSINLGDTVVRKGEVLVEKPALLLPPNIPQLTGFDFDEKANSFNQDSITNFLYVRGINIPSLKYNNITSSMDIFEGGLSSAITHYDDLLKQQENMSTGLIAGPEDCWQFSLLVFVCSQITRNLEADVRRLLEDYQRKKLE